MPAPLGATQGCSTFTAWPGGCAQPNCCAQPIGYFRTRPRFVWQWQSVAHGAIFSVTFGAMVTT